MKYEITYDPSRAKDQLPWHLEYKGIQTSSQTEAGAFAMLGKILKNREGKQCEH